jgi:hypothetical protein
MLKQARDAAKRLKAAVNKGIKGASLTVHQLGSRLKKNAPPEPALNDTTPAMNATIAQQGGFVEPLRAWCSASSTLVVGAILVLCFALLAVALIAYSRW